MASIKFLVSTPYVRRGRRTRLVLGAVIATVFALIFVSNALFEQTPAAGIVPGVFVPTIIVLVIALWAWIARTAHAGLLPDVGEGESLLWHGRARLLGSRFGQDGVLSLTSERLVFVAEVFVGDPEPVARQREWLIDEVAGVVVEDAEYERHPGGWGGTVGIQLADDSTMHLRVRDAVRARADLAAKISALRPE